jgi:hypothetical protein
MPLLTQAAALLGAGLLAQSAQEPFNVACNTAFAPTRPPLSTLLPAGTAFANCIRIEGWGDSARFVPGTTGGGGGAGRVVLDAFNVTLRGEVPEVMLLRQRQLTGQAITGTITLWQVRPAPSAGGPPAQPAGALGGVELTQVLVQSVTSSITADGYATNVLLQPRTAIWRAWRTPNPDPSDTADARFEFDFSTLIP